MLALLGVSSRGLPVCPASISLLISRRLTLEGTSSSLGVSQRAGTLGGCCVLCQLRAGSDRASAPGGSEKILQKSCFEKLGAVHLCVQIPAHRGTHVGVAESSGPPLWGEGGVIPGKASSAGPTVERAGLCASPSEGGGALSCSECVRQGLA